ncbi:MAG: phenylalanine--tRNA ligase subunit beta [Candidatus Saccharimonadales bacterium]
MKVSVNWIRQFLDFELPAIDELVAKIGSQLGEVEEVVDFGKKYQGIIVAKVVECYKHEDSDHLNVCKIDDGGKAQNVERHENGLVQVVCGAPNVRKDLVVAWLPPGSTVPSSFDNGTSLKLRTTGDSFVLETREIRGVKSNGMLASAKELVISDDHEGILEIDKDVEPGTDFAETFKLNDYVIDIENKMFTHRPDCFGALGVAREISGILQRPFTSPAWYQTNPEFSEIESEQLKLEVQNDLPELVPRFTAITMSDVKVGPSPLWLQIALAKVGQKSINNIVDLTNFYMLVTGQPLHAYDYDKVKSLSNGEAKIVVRYPQSGEKVKLLNGKEIEPRSEAIMIATDQKLIGLGGVMGGSETEVDASTKNIILESASFDMYSIRRTSMAHGLFTDAVTRFNKGQSALQTLAVLAKIVNDLAKLASGQVASDVIDSQQNLPSQKPVSVTVEFINARLGLTLIASEIKSLLENVEFQVDDASETLAVLAPFWRTDIEIPEDVVEEVGRLYGYDKLPLELPKRSIKPAEKDPALELKAKIRATLAKAGANEVLTYSFVHGNLLEKSGQNKDNAYQISNALSPDLQYYRLSLMPSLLDKVHQNIKAGYDEFALFELGKTHVQHEPDPTEPHVPKEINALSLVYAAKNSSAGASYYYARKYFDNLMQTFGIADSLKLEALSGADLYKNPWLEEMAAPFEPKRSAVLRDTVGILPGTKGLIWGIVGEFKTSVQKALKLPDYCAGFELDPLLFSQAKNLQTYLPLSRYPKIEQDICLKVASDLDYQELAGFVSSELEKSKPEQTLLEISPLDIYQRDDDQTHKQITFRIQIASYEKTMTDAEVAKLLDELAAAASQKLAAARI